MLSIICIILIISFFDLRAIIKNKQQSDMICFAAIAIAGILYGYYYTTHIYNASFIGFFLELLHLE